MLFGIEVVKIELINNIVKEMLEKHVGGERFFDNLDDKLRNSNIIEHMLTNILIAYDKDMFDAIVMSGKFGVFFNNYFDFSIRDVIDCDRVVVRGGLRHEFMDGELEYLKDVIAGKRFIFVDDSFFSGHTRNSIKKEIERLGGSLSQTYVAYDGSKERDSTVRSLYRYYK